MDRCDMSGRGWARSRDANEKPIVDALRTAGCNVYRLDGDPGVLDLLVQAPCHESIRELLDLLPVLAMGKLTDVDTVDEIVKRLPRRRWVLLEVKNPASTSGVKKTIKAVDLDKGGKYEDVLKYCTRNIARLCKESQGDFLLANSAPMAVVSTVEEALAAVGLTPPAP